MSRIYIGLNAIRKFKNWHTYIMDFFHLIKKPIIVYELRNGVKYEVRSGTRDRNIISEIWINNLYTPKGFEINEGDVVFDIGAHIGIFSVFASKHAGKNGKVFSFEPSPDNFYLLKKNIILNNSINTELVNKAVSDKNGAKTLFLSKNNTGGHSFFSQHLDYENKIEVETISLDSFLGEKKISKIDFLKMDCEGAEYEILLGCSKKTLNTIEKISMEYHDEYKLNTLCKFLEMHGFEITKPKKISVIYAKKRLGKASNKLLHKVS